MSFYTRYEMMDILQDGPVKTFSARQNATGRTVAVHLFLTRTPETTSLFQQVRNVGDPQGAEILEIGEHEGTPFVVTTEWQRRQSFADWLAGADAPQGAER